MDNFASQIKDKFLGLVDRVTGAGFGRAAGGKDVQEPAKLHTVERVAVRSRAAEPVVDGGSSAGAN